MSGMSPLSPDNPTSKFNFGHESGLSDSQQPSMLLGPGQGESIAAKLEQFKNELKKSNEAISALRKRTVDLNQSEETSNKPGNLNSTNNMTHDHIGALSQ